MNSLLYKTRKVLLLMHRWVGVAMALFLVIVGLTGSLLAFRSSIDAFLNPGLYVSPPANQEPLAMGVLAERAEALDPHARVGFFAVERGTVGFHMMPRTDPATGKPYTDAAAHLSLNPYTGERLHCGPATNPGRSCRDVMGFVYSLHTSLATNTSEGWTFVGIIALLWTIDALVAIWLTFPPGTRPFWQRWRLAWGIKWRANSTRVNFDIHRAGGLWLWPLLFIFGWSSVMLGLSQVYEPVMHTLFNSTTSAESMAQRSVPTPLETPKLGWREAERIGAQVISKEAALHHFTIERPYGMAYIAEYGGYTYAVRSNLDIRAHSWDTSVLIDGNTGRLRVLDLPHGQKMGDTIGNVLWGIHYGDLRGWLPYRILIALFGIFLAILSYTGVRIWWKKRVARKLSVARHSPSKRMVHVG